MRRSKNATDELIEMLYKLLHLYFFAVLLRWTFWIFGALMLRFDPGFPALLQTLPTAKLFLFLGEHPLFNQILFLILHLLLGMPGLILLIAYSLYPIFVGRWLRKVICMLMDLHFNMHVQPHCQKVSRDFIRIIDLESKTEEIQDVGTAKQLQIHLDGHKPIVCRVEIKKTRYYDTAILIGQNDTIIANLQPGEARTFLLDDASTRILMVYCPVRLYTQRPEWAEYAGQKVR